AFVALVSANSKSGFFVFPSSEKFSLICIFSIGSNFQKLSWLLAFIAASPLSSPICPLYKILYSVLNACEFLDKKVFFLVEHAIKKNKNINVKLYLKVLFFN